MDRACYLTQKVVEAKSELNVIKWEIKNLEWMVTVLCMSTLYEDV